MPPTLQQARHKDRIVGVTWLSLEAVELNPGSIYEARLRVQMTLLEEDDMAEERYYKSHWSEWSQPVSFPSPQRWRQGRCYVVGASSQPGLSPCSLVPSASSLFPQPTAPPLVSGCANS